MTEEQLRLLSRLVKTQDGKDFVEEVLQVMLFKNHKDLLTEGKVYRDELIGFGNAISLLIELFNTCDDKLAARKKTDPPEWA